jgi:hypothetical protein
LARICQHDEQTRANRASALAAGKGALAGNLPDRKLKIALAAKEPH